MVDWKKGRNIPHRKFYNLLLSDAKQLDALRNLPIFQNNEFFKKWFEDQERRLLNDKLVNWEGLNQIIGENDPIRLEIAKHADRFRALLLNQLFKENK